MEHGPVQARGTVYRCLRHRATQYLLDCYILASDVAIRQRLRSASHHQLAVPHYGLRTLGRRSFITGPMVWNSVPERPFVTWRATSTLLKSENLPFLVSTSVCSASEVSALMRYINLLRLLTFYLPGEMLCRYVHITKVIQHLYC